MDGFKELSLRDQLVVTFLAVSLTLSAENPRRVLRETKEKLQDYHLHRAAQLQDYWNGKALEGSSHPPPSQAETQFAATIIHIFRFVDQLPLREPQ
ncbi:MAG: hypothetical protein OXN90_10620 [Gemmatimonadota bacterium]|nr:hypothetical protein [Gemmatimonadota bacterium]